MTLIRKNSILEQLLSMGNSNVWKDGINISALGQLQLCPQQIQKGKQLLIILKNSTGIKVLPGKRSSAMRNLVFWSLGRSRWDEEYTNRIPFLHSRTNYASSLTLDDTNWQLNQFTNQLTISKSQIKSLKAQIIKNTQPLWHGEGIFFGPQRCFPSPQPLYKSCLGTGKGCRSWQL